MTASLAIIRVDSTSGGLDVNAFAAASGLHPDLVRRFVALGLLAPRTDEAGRLWFRPSDVATVARIKRLRAGFGLNYAAIGLVLDLLDRLEARGASVVGSKNHGPQPADSEVTGSVARCADQGAATFRCPRSPGGLPCKPYQRCWWSAVAR
jgi:chaperone modulatory protein CbpM